MGYADFDKNYKDDSTYQLVMLGIRTMGQQAVDKVVHLTVSASIDELCEIVDEMKEEDNRDFEMWKEALQISSVYIAHILALTEQAVEDSGLNIGMPNPNYVENLFNKIIAEGSLLQQTVALSLKTIWVEQIDDYLKSDMFMEKEFANIVEEKLADLKNLNLEEE